MKTSYHVHSLYSDGKTSIPTILSYAEEFQLDEIGMSDHFVLHPEGKKYIWGMSYEDLLSYIQEVIELKKTNSKLRLGLEVDFFEKTISEIEKLLGNFPFDYLIGSVHIIEKYDLDVSLTAFNRDIEEDVVRRYWLLVEKMASSSFDIMGHLDIYKKYNRSNILLPKECDRALLAIKDFNKVVEVNTAGWKSLCNSTYPSLEILKKCQRLSIPIILTSDAHHPQDLTKDFDRAIPLLLEIGFKEQVCFLNKEKFFFSFI